MLGVEVGTVQIMGREREHKGVGSHDGTLGLRLRPSLLPGQGAEGLQTKLQQAVGGGTGRSLQEDLE